MRILFWSNEYLKILVDMIYGHIGLHNYNNDNNILVLRILENCY